MDKTTETQAREEPIDNILNLGYYKRKLIKTLTERVSILRKFQRAGDSVSPVSVADDRKSLPSCKTQRWEIPAK